MLPTDPIRSPLGETETVAAFAALGHSTRWSVVRLLGRYAPAALPAGEIARLLAVAPATLSAHLDGLEAAGLVSARRDGRVIAYRLVPASIEAIGEQLAAVSDGTHRGNGTDVQPGSLPWRVLFVCTRNAARSIMAEALLNRIGAGRFIAASAGSVPAAGPDPDVLTFLQGVGIATETLTSKSWRAFSGQHAPSIDLVVTLCDDAAGENCPVFIGNPVSVHWGIRDPLAGTTTAADKRDAIRTAYRHISARLTALATLDFSALTQEDLYRHLARLGAMDGATALAIARAA